MRNVALPGGSAKGARLRARCRGGLREQREARVQCERGGRCRCRTRSASASGRSGRWEGRRGEREGTRSAQGAGGGRLERVMWELPRRRHEKAGARWEEKHGECRRGPARGPSESRHGRSGEAGTGADSTGSAGEGQAGTSEQRGGKGQARGEREGAGAAGDAQDVWRAGQRARGLPRPWDVARGNRRAAARPRHVMMGTARALLAMMPACRFEPRWARCGSARPDVIHHVPCQYILYNGLGEGTGLCCINGTTLAGSGFKSRER